MRPDTTRSTRTHRGELDRTSRPAKLVVVIHNQRSWSGEVYRTQGGGGRLAFAGVREFLHVAQSLLAHEQHRRPI